MSVVYIRSITLMIVDALKLNDSAGSGAECLQNGRIRRHALSINSAWEKIGVKALQTAQQSRFSLGEMDGQFPDTDEIDNFQPWFKK